MKKVEQIKLSQGEKNIIKALKGKLLLAISKTETKAVLIYNDDYSFFKNINHWEFDSMNQKGLLKKVDSRVVSVMYELSDLGKSIEIL